MGTTVNVYPGLRLPRPSPPPATSLLTLILKKNTRRVVKPLHSALQCVLHLVITTRLSLDLPFTEIHYSLFFFFLCYSSGHLTRKPYGCFGSPVKQNKRCSFVACFSAMRDLMFVYYSWSQINWYSTLFGQVRDPSPAISRAGVARYARSPAVPSDRGLGHGRAQRWARGGQFPAAGLGSVRRVACDRRRRRPGRVALIILPFVAVDRHGPEIRWPYHGESPKNKTREPFFTFPPTNPLQSSDERRPPPLTSWL